MYLSISKWVNVPSKWTLMKMTWYTFLNLFVCLWEVFFFVSFWKEIEIRSPRYQLTRILKNAENDCSLNWKIMMKHPAESSHWRRIFPKVILPPLPLSPALLTARHSSHGGTDRLTNKVNKYFPPLLKANQILIFEVWSAEKKYNKQLVEGNWLNWL